MPLRTVPKLFPQKHCFSLLASPGAGEPELHGALAVQKLHLCPSLPSKGSASNAGGCGGALETLPDPQWGMGSEGRYRLVPPEEKPGTALSAQR